MLTSRFGALAPRPHLCPGWSRRCSSAIRRAHMVAQRPPGNTSQPPGPSLAAGGRQTMPEQTRRITEATRLHAAGQWRAWHVTGNLGGRGGKDQLEELGAGDRVMAVWRD